MRDSELGFPDPGAPSPTFLDWARQGGGGAPLDGRPDFVSHPLSKHHTAP